MSKLHSTVSRRDFMKGLGLAGAGLGAAAAAAPVFHDLDEMAGSPSALWRRPWYVQEVEKPTAEVDWNVMTFFDDRETLFDNGAFARAVGMDEIGRIFALNAEHTRTWIAQDKPGATLRDVALDSATGFGFAYGLQGNWVPQQIVSTPEDNGAVPWQGTPEENLRMLRTAARYYGAKDIGVFELDQNTRKTVYSHERDGKAYVFENVNDAYETDTKRVIPDKAKYVVMFNTLESQEMLKRAPDHLSSATVALAYNQGALVGNRLQQFLRGIGYQGLVEMMSNAIVQCAGGNSLAGMSEVSRMSLTTLSPEYGPMMRTFKFITDLPLAPTSPIDAGMFTFCRTCKLCANACPSSAISSETEPSYDVQGTWNKPGIKNYYYNGAKCLTYWFESVVGCGICRSACPFGQKDKAIIHDWLVKPTVATVPWFNGFFANMGEVFGYDRRGDDAFSLREEKQSWWDIEEAPVYGFDTTRYARKLQ